MKMGNANDAFDPIAGSVSVFMPFDFTQFISFLNRAVLAAGQRGCWPMKHITFIRFRSAFAAAMILPMAHRSYARLGPVRDPREGILDSSLVLIVSKARTNSFRVEEVVLGAKKIGDTISLPDLRLYTVHMYGPERVEPITPETRVLLFLKSNEKAPDTFEVTHDGECFFWVQDVAKVGDLRRQAEDAVKLRRSWEQAKGIQDERKRVEALWPYLWGHGVSFLRHTQKELQRMGAVAGDYIAERLPGMSPGERMTLLPELGAYGSERLHAALINYLQQQQKGYDAFLKNHGPDKKSLIEDWNSAPNEIKDTWGQLYYGLTGLASFRDRRDLPFVRKLALWAIDYRFKQTCDAALGAFRDMPDKANLPVIDAIWKEFSTRPYKGNELSPFDVTRALSTHRFPETVPVLAQLLGNDKANNEARAFLTAIVDQDLGENPKEWLDWYESHK
jgi:hypothetical protein